MHEGPRLKDTQLQQLRNLIAKRGWDEATFAAVAKTPVDALNPSQARQWITKLTKDTNGKPRLVQDSTVSVVPPVRHRQKQLSDATAIPRSGVTATDE